MPITIDILLRETTIHYVKVFYKMIFNIQKLREYLKHYI